MGLFRKITSLSTVGLVDFRSNKERTAAYTRQTRDAVRAQSRPSVRESMASIRASRAAIREAEASQAMLEGVRSADPAVRAAALAEYRRSR